MLLVLMYVVFPNDQTAEMMINIGANMRILLELV